MIATENGLATLALRPREAAKALGISPRLLWQLTHDGDIPCVRVGTGKRRTILYPTADLQAWLSRQAAQAQRVRGACNGLRILLVPPGGVALAYPLQFGRPVR